MQRIAPTLVTSLFFIACGAEPVPTVERVNLALKGDNGVSLNGTTFGGLSLSKAYGETLSPTGSLFRFPTSRFLSNPFDPVSGAGPNGPALSGAQLSGLGSIAINGDIDVADMVGAQVTGRVGRTEVLLEVGGIAQGEAPNDDLLYYAVYVADGLGWSPVCGMSDTGEPIPAIAVPGVWDHSQGTDTGGQWTNDGHAFSFACRGSSIAKCVEIGYKPWIDPASKDGRINLRREGQLVQANHLQACVRMLRADYCGNGTPFTVDGRKVEFWDSMSMHQEDMNWHFEGAWSPSGIQCMSSPRVKFDGRVPSCVRDRVPTRSRKYACAGGDPSSLYTNHHRYLFSSFESQLR